MTKKADNDALNGLHSLLAEVLQKQIAGEEVAASVLAVAAKFLKDNGITASPGHEGMSELQKALEDHFPDVAEEEAQYQETVKEFH